MTNLKLCNCSERSAAQESGTDNEMYASALSGYQGFWEIGSGLKPIKYCPWCGKLLPPIEQVYEP